MKKIAVFGAGGRAGRAITAEAARRGHSITAVVRNPRGYPESPARQGDVTSADSIAQVAQDHDAVVHAAADLTVPAGVFFPSVARALGQVLTGQRLIAVGLASVLPAEDGVLLMDSAGYPQDYRSFYEGHGDGVRVLKETSLDWLMLSPAGDFAVAVVDQIDNPTYHGGASGGGGVRLKGCRAR